jgi:hypothetical protein
MIAGHRYCTGLAGGFQVENETKSHIARNLPIFGKALIVAAASFAPTAHDLYGVETVMAMTTPAKRMPCDRQSGVTSAQCAGWIFAEKARR